MGNRPSRWGGGVLHQFGPRRFVRLRSSSQIQPLLKHDRFAETNYLKLTGVYEADMESAYMGNPQLVKKVDELIRKVNGHEAYIESTRKRNSELGKKVDELNVKVSELRSRTCKGCKDNKSHIEKLQKKNVNVEGEIKQLKEISAQKVNSIIASVNKAEIERIQKKNTSLKDEMKILRAKVAALEAQSAVDQMEGRLQLLDPRDIIFAGILIMIFLICILIGMHLPWSL